MLLKLCPNGARTPHEHPALSADPDATAAECAHAVRLGIGAIHIHPKDASGEDSLRGPDVDRWVGAFRRHYPHLPLGITTGEWALPDLSERLREIKNWKQLPDFASVNWHETGADEIAAALLSRGISVEAGIWNETGLNAWVGSPVRAQCLRVLIEIQDVLPDQAKLEGKWLVDGVSAFAPGMPILLHGEKRSTWVALQLAAKRGVDTRIGLEDCLRLPNGEIASGNTELTQAALQMILLFNSARHERTRSPQG